MCLQGERDELTIYALQSSYVSSGYLKCCAFRCKMHPFDVSERIEECAIVSAIEHRTALFSSDAADIQTQTDGGFWWDWCTVVASYWPRDLTCSIDKSIAVLQGRKDAVQHGLNDSRNTSTRQTYVGNMKGTLTRYLQYLYTGRSAIRQNGGCTRTQPASEPRVYFFCSSFFGSGFGVGNWN